MKLTYFGNAMILMEGENSKVLCDPWVTFDRISSSGLFTFPELKVSKFELAEIEPDFIYISHTHEDHFDPITLNVFNKDTPILVSYYANNFTAKRVAELGFSNVMISDPENGLPLNGDDHCWIEPNGVYSDVDSLGVFKIDGKTVLNANDNPFSEDQCKNLYDRFGSIDLACLPYSFQGPYPAFYENLSKSERELAATEKKTKNYEIVSKFIQVLQPKKVFLFAAGAVYGGKKALLFDGYGVGTPDEAIDYLNERHHDLKTVLLSQKMSYDLTTNKTQGKYELIRYQDEVEYLEAISKLKGPFEEGGTFFIAKSEQIDLSKLLTKARERQHGWQIRRKIVSDAVFFLDVGQDELYRLCLGDLNVSKVQEGQIIDEAYEIFRMPYSLLIAMLTQHYNYSNVKTQHMTFFRKPDKFNPDLHILMSFLQL
jgi:hypothetical protein